MYTGIVGSGQETIELTASVVSGKQELLIGLLQNSLFAKPIEPVTVMAATNSEILEVLRDGSLLLRTFNAPAVYWLVFPEAPDGASAYWVRFDCLPPLNETEEIFDLRLGQQHAMALSHLRGQRLRAVSAFAASR